MTIAADEVTYKLQPKVGDTEMETSNDPVHSETPFPHPEARLRVSGDKIPFLHLPLIIIRRPDPTGRPLG